MAQVEKPDNVVDIRRQSSIRPFLEVGRSGLARFSGMIYEEFLPVLRGRSGVRVYTEMQRNDSVIGACIQAYEQTIRNVEWRVRPAEFTPEGIEAAEFLRSCMDDMSHTWDDTITDILSFLTYGWAWMEVVFKTRRGESRDPRRHSRYTDGMIGWRKIALRKQSSFFRWDFDDSGEVEAFVQQPPPDYRTRTIPISRSLLFRTKISGGNPEGVSVLRNCYRSWFLKKNIEEIESIGIERDLIGLPQIKPPEKFDIKDKDNVDVVAAISDMLYNLRRDEQDGIFLPPGWEIELLGTGGGGARRQFDLDKVITRWDKRIAISLLANAIMLGMDRVGSFALAKSQVDNFFLISVQGYLSSIAEIFNRFGVSTLFNLNPRFTSLGIQGKLPTIEPGKVTTPGLEEIGNFIEKATKSGYLIQDEDVLQEMRHVGGFGAPSVRRTQVVTENGGRSSSGELKDPLASQQSSSPPSNGGGSNGNGDAT